MRKYLVVLLLFVGACIPLSVVKLTEQDFKSYEIPQSIALVRINDTPAALSATESLAMEFGKAGFTVVYGEELNQRIAGAGLKPEDVIPQFDWQKIGKAAGTEAVVSIRQFYGIEILFVESATGQVRSGGCWRSGYARVVTEVIDQLKEDKPGRQRCPAPMVK